MKDSHFYIIRNSNDGFNDLTLIIKNLNPKLYKI